MKQSELRQIRLQWLNEHHPYKMLHWSKFDYSILSNIMYIRRSGKGSDKTYNDVIIMADTETSKKDPTKVTDNHVVAWTISLRAFNRNIVTLWGHRPDTMITCIDKLKNSMQGDLLYIYFHNLSYDWVFLRKFMFSQFGTPEKQLNTKSHYPIAINFSNGIILKDSLILAQRNLQKWAEDLGAEHQKAVGKWDYDKLRNQKEVFTADELEYIEHDTLAGVECLQILMDTLNKHIYSMPYTATGIPREAVRKIGKDYRAHDRFKSMALSYEEQSIMEMVYHGGYTHGYRHRINTTLENVEAYDFASSYPFVLLSEKYPIEKFTEFKDCEVDTILKYSDEYAFYFKLIMLRPRLKDNFVPMPALQFSKCTKTLNAVLDNGRILCAEYAEIWITEQDLSVICEQYDFDEHIAHHVMFARKDYLPKWLTDYIYSLFEAKTTLKGGDKVQYALAKAKLNSIYGMMVQKPCKDLIIEDYGTGAYTTQDDTNEEAYNKYVKSHNTILPYQWGVWVTAYAYRNLFKLGACVDYENGGVWAYSDTDSCYATKWNIDKINEYNNQCKEKLLNNGYGAVFHNDREYWLGVAEFDGAYSEYRVCGAKRYCGRSVKDGELHITVAGVPKKGAICLNNDIENFRAGLIFSGALTGKMTHTYFYVDDIYTDKDGNITGDSIDLSQCDYLLDDVERVDWEKIYREEIEVQVYDEE